MIADMEMTLTPTDIQRIFRISKTWYYRLKKAAQYNNTGTRNLYKNCIKAAKSNGQEVKIDIDSFNKVAKAKADAMSAADTTRFADVPIAARRDVLNTLIDTSEEVTPEQIATEVRATENLFFQGSMKFKVDGNWKEIKFSVGNDNYLVEGDTDQETKNLFNRACETYLFQQVNTTL